MVVIKPKRPLVHVPFLQDMIVEILSAQTEESLVLVLEKFNAPFSFERPEERNLLNWFKVLNRFDELLDRYVSSRNIFTTVSSHRLESSPLHNSSPSDPRLRRTTFQPPPKFPVASPSKPYAKTVSGSSTIDALTPKPKAEQDKFLTLFVPSSSMIMLILRVTQRLIRNASHDTRTVYNSVDYLGALLADDNSAIVLLALEVITMLLQRSPKLRPTRTQITMDLSERLLDLAVGWGGREIRLGLLDCCSSKNMGLPSEGGRLHFEYAQNSSSARNGNQSSNDSPQHREEGLSSEPNDLGKKPTIEHNSVIGSIPLTPGAATQVSGVQEPLVTVTSTRTSIIVPDVVASGISERYLLSEFASRHRVPKKELFSLLSAFRRAKCFGEGRSARLEVSVLRLFAITILFQLQPLPSRLNDVLGKEPELVHDIVALASADKRDGVDDIPWILRITAVRCLTAMSSDRVRFASILNATGVNVHHGALPTLLRTEIGYLLSTSSSDNSRGEEGGDAMSMDRASDIPVTIAVHQTVRNGIYSVLCEADRLSNNVQRILMSEAVLSLVHSVAVSSGSSGSTPLANYGLLGILTPLLADSDVEHARVVSQAIRAMQSIMEGCSQTLGCQLFRDHNGLTLVAKRIESELNLEDCEDSELDQSEADEAVEVAALERRGECRALYERLGNRQMSAVEALENLPPSSGTAARGLLPHSKWALLRALHQLLLRALGNGGSEVRELIARTKLSKALRKILAQPFQHGGSLFQSAATITTEIAHAEPTATAELVKAGLASTVLRTIRLGLPPCGEAVRCIPNLLAALCLAPNARDDIVREKPLKLFLLRLATPFYTRALHGECPVTVGSAMDELMRHVEALRPDGNEAMFEYLRLSAEFVETEATSIRRAPRVNSTLGTAKVDRTLHGNKTSKAENNCGSGVGSGLGDQDKKSPDSILLERMKLAVANNSCRLAGFAQGSSEHQEGIVLRGGLDYMIRLRYAPALASPEISAREGPAYARHYPTPAHTLNSLGASLRNFSSRHATPVLKCLFSVILQDGATVLKLGKELGGCWLPEEDCREDGGINRSEMGDDDRLKIFSEDSRSTKNPLLGNRGSCKTDCKGGVNSTNSGQDLPTVDLRQLEEKRSGLRKQMSDALKKLRVGVTLLSGLFSRGGPGTSAHVWESAKGSQLAAVVSTVERAARYHLAVVYTSLTLSASSDGDLNSARVTAAADPELISLSTEHVSEVLGDVENLFGWPVTSEGAFKEACERYKVPPSGPDVVRQNVEGLAWCMVTFAVAAQRLYSTLSKALTFSSRRLARDSARHTTSSRSLAATIGRIFALHLITAESLWDVNVITMGGDKVIAAWDYIRGILIEMKGTLFDESQRGTQSVILTSFLEAGGAGALLRATKPFEIVLAVSGHNALENSTDGVLEKPDQKGKDSFSTQALLTTSYMLALRDTLKNVESKRGVQNDSWRALGGQLTNTERNETVISSELISNQARALSRIVVSEADSDHREVSLLPTDAICRNKELNEILRNSEKMQALELQSMNVRDLALQRCKRKAVQRVASDVWNTLCQFLHLLGSCPRLLSGNSSIPEAAQSTDWEPREIQRSCLTVTLGLLESVTNCPENVLAAFNPEASAMSDLLGIFHTTSQLAGELSRKKHANRIVAIPDEVQMHLDRREDPQPPGRTSPDPGMLRSLVEMGFSERNAADALRRTAPGGLEYATEWLLSHRNGEEDSESVGSDDAAERQYFADGDNEEEQNGQENIGTGEDDAVPDGDGESTHNYEQGEIEGVSDIEPASIMHPASDGEPEQEWEGPDEDMVDSSPNELRNLPNTFSGPANAGESNFVTGPESMSCEKRDEEDGNAQPETEKSNARVEVGILQNDICLLQDSLATEMELLLSGLKKAEIIPAKDIGMIISVASSYFEPKFVQAGSTSEKSCKDAAKRNSLPVSVDSFVNTKSRIFQSLLQVTRVILQYSSKHVHRMHLPYVITELLSILLKDGSLGGGGTAELAHLLRDGLQFSITEDQHREDGDFRGGLGHSATLWSHYGGNNSRRALQACGTFQLAFDYVLRTVENWEGVSRSPQVDIEATHPIQKLSIHEEKSGIARERAGKPRSGMKGETMLPMVTSHGLRLVSKREALDLQNLSTCLLHLDAMVRYEDKDAVIEKAMENGEDGCEKMDTDAAIDGDGTAADKAKIDLGISREERKTLNDLMRDSLSPVMEVNRFSDEGELDLGTIRSAAITGKEKLTESAKRAVTSWTRKDVCTPSICTENLLRKCVSLLRLWQKLEVGDALLSLLHLIGSLTAKWNLAQLALTTGLIPLLLSLPHLRAGHATSTDYRIVQSLTKTILRHLIEDPDTLQEAMVAELRGLLSSGQSRSRPPFTVKSLITVTAPLAARNIDCYISAFTIAVRGTESERRGELHLTENENTSTADLELLLQKRPNVSAVISGMAALLCETSNESREQNKVLNPEPFPSSKSNEDADMPVFALEVLSEFVEFSQIAAVALMKTPSPCNKVQGSAVDYVVQKLLPVHFYQEKGVISLLRMSAERETELSKSARSLFLAMCSRTANAHEDAVRSLARAIKLEADKLEVSPGCLFGLAQCVVPHTRLTVLRAMLDSKIGNDLARSLKTLDIGIERNFEVATSVLRAISLIGHAANYLARQGSDTNEDISFGSNSSREPWAPLRERDYVVL